MVKVVFDNVKRILPIDFDEVVIERIVHRDGINEYLINGSLVRLKDIIELLASAHIGASGHHIISQGEADKILNANLRDRRSMIEDALGLKIYQYKKEESSRKLEKTEENIKEVELLRREIAPHIKFLKKQVEKIEKALELKQNLVALYKEYFKREDVYLKHERRAIEEEKRAPQAELAELGKELAILKEVVGKSATQDSSRSPELIALESKLSETRTDKDATTRELGRIEGELSYLKRSLEKRNDELSKEKTKTVYLHEVEELYREIDFKLADAEKTPNPDVLRSVFDTIRSLISSFISRNKDKAEHNDTESLEKEMDTLQHDKHSFEKKLLTIKHEEQTLSHQYTKIKEEIERGKDENVEAEKAILKIMTRQNELHSKLSSLQGREEKFVAEDEDFKRELQDAAYLGGREALNYEHVILETVGEERHAQLERKRHLEKMKIRLEETGVGGSDDVMKEFREAEERDAFLGKELADLQSSAVSLDQLITELDEKLNTEFKEGVRKINEEFGKFFALMFGGGTAKLMVVREEVRKRKPLLDELEMDDIAYAEAVENAALEETLGKEGLDIEVNLPRKKIKGLVMLSGGERALTSIALLFAISQVNPPPFIILDETDAALDEANSRKYGDMVENLSKHSQLIVITHNRETMSRAGILYGITMGSDGVSKLLSIAFDEAVKVAK